MKNTDKSIEKIAERPDTVSLSKATDTDGDVLDQLDGDPFASTSTGEPINKTLADL